jgi:hypothetical protein
VGPISGLRIVNLRVRDKVAYPDLTIDLAGGDADHLVVGLENGGGKSTLLGAVYHVFVPEADQFLPRRAQRRQHKEGELKRLEHYVPGGDPTHFVVEVETPMPDGNGVRGQSSRMLVGACLWKPSGSTPSTPANEFFWSTRSVVPELSLRNLVLRGPGGRLLDHREFKAKLTALRAEVPAAHINIEDGKGAWEKHLRDLGIDVEYVRQFLLRMNEDEGAADQVFTYASSRSFLNSLVGVVGDPAAIEQLKQRLAEMSRDADAMSLDRQRVALLDKLVMETGPLAATVRNLNLRIAERDRVVGQLLACHDRATRYLADVRRAASAAAERRADLERAMVESRNVYNDANARYVLARVQVARIRVEISTAEIQRVERERDDARTTERVARAAALLADRRTNDARVRDLEELLTRKEIEAEPLRVSLASAVRALTRRLAADIERLTHDRNEASATATRASQELERAGTERAKLEKTLGELDGERKGLVAARAAIEQQFEDAVDKGVLSRLDADPTVELHHARTRAAAEQLVADEQEHQRQRASDALKALAERDRTLAVDLGRAEEAISVARSELDKAVVRTDQLVSAITRSGFVELDPVILDDHAEAVCKRLDAVIESAKLKQAAAAVSVAAADRATMWLRDHECLPPRPDVERICDSARADRLGARPGWSYLSTLAEDIAAGFAAAQPGLADGIVVNVPEDLDAVIALVSAARDDLDGPIVIGLAGAFGSDAIERDCTVVLPHHARWSTAAGRALVDARSAEASRWRTEYEAAHARADEALSLRERLAAWTTEVGIGGLDRRRTKLQDSEGIRTRVVAEREELGRAILDGTSAQSAAESARDAARTRHAAAVTQARELEALATQRDRASTIDERLDAIDAAATRAKEASDAALTAIAKARGDQESANQRVVALATTIAEISTEHTSVAALAAVTVRPDDTIDPIDEDADRELLAHQVRDRESRWRGAVTDPELRARLAALQGAVAEITKQLGRFAEVSEQAHRLLAADPSRSKDDYVGDADSARAAVEVLVGQIGEFKATERQLKTELEKVNDEFKALRRPAALVPDETTSNIDGALGVRDRLRSAQIDAMNARTAREAEHEAALGIETAAAARVELLEVTLQRLSTAWRRLVGGGMLVPAIDTSELAPTLNMDAVLADPALLQAFATLLRTAGRSIDVASEVSLDADKASVAAELERIDAEVDGLERILVSLDKRAEAALDATDVLLRAASENVVRGDKIIQTLRTATRRALADLSLAHHEDIVQRLAAVRHHVASFDARVEALADTVYATIADLLREVRRTVRESQLPNTPAMGRWAGAELLELSGLDTLKVDQRRAAVAAKLRGWFNPDDQEHRPGRFDSNDVVHDLLHAVTPQFTARILIPSDPLDPEHKPVDHLALETSGGEGVTVALILASLLASRRASARGHRRTTLLLDNPFAKVTKPEFLRLARDVADELSVQLVAFTGIKDLGALTVFPRLTQLRVSRRENANFVVPFDIEDERLQPLLRNGTLFVSPAEWAAAKTEDAAAWPLMSAVSVASPRTRGNP